MTRYKKQLSGIDRGVIVLIVFGAFCESFAQQLWSNYDAGALVSVFVVSALLLTGSSCFTVLAARKLKLSRAEEATALFCGSQKSLVSGAPIARILFGSDPALAMIMMPLLIYHQMQLIVGAILARRYAEN